MKEQKNELKTVCVRHVRNIGNDWLASFSPLTLGGVRLNSILCFRQNSRTHSNNNKKRKLVGHIPLLGFVLSKMCVLISQRGGLGTIAIRSPPLPPRAQRRGTESLLDTSCDLVSKFPPSALRKSDDHSRNTRGERPLSPRRREPGPGRS